MHSIALLVLWIVFMALGDSNQAIGGKPLWNKEIVAQQIYQMLEYLAALVMQLKR